MKRMIPALLCFLIAGPAGAQREAVKTFTNPLLPSGADPWTIYKNGFYYYTHTMGNRIMIWKTRNMAALANAEKKTVFVPPPGQSYSRQLWVPEIHFVQDKWYIYFAADDGNNSRHRIYVLENASPDPMQGQWTFKGKIADPSDKWAIDASVFSYKNKWYITWSGWEGDVNGQQNIYIAQMKNPWTIGGERVKISAPTYTWEKDGDLNNNNDVPHVNVNEGPEALIHNNKLFIIYSASGCWTDSYALGMLTFTGNNNLLDSAAWHKSPEPVFRQSAMNGVYAPGHNSFFQSPNGQEYWILYHANSAPGQGCGGHRSPRMQRFTWNKDGTPDFGVPVAAGKLLTAPAQ